jgi:hypothetical protein
VLWLIVVACGFGILLGLLWLGWPSVVAASGTIVLLCSVVMPHAGWSPLMTIAFIFALMVALQCGYLIGLVLSHTHVIAEKFTGLRLRRNRTSRE